MYLLRYNTGYGKWYFLIDIDIFCTIGSKNKYSAKQLDNLVKVKTAQKQPTTNRLLHCVLLNQLFLTFAKKSRSVFVFSQILSQFLEHSFRSLLT